MMAGFFPGKKYGGPPVSVDNFCSLMSEYECYIVTHNHDKGSKEAYVGIASNEWITRSNCNVMYLSDTDYNAVTFEKVAIDINPDVIYLQGLFQTCIYPCLKIAKKMSVKVILAPRGELCSGAFKKKYKKIPYIFLLKIQGLLQNVTFQSTSEEETNAIQKYLGVSRGDICLATNIPSIPKESIDRSSKEIGEAKFVFISRIHPKKNLKFAIKCLLKISGRCVFNIYGPIEDESYWNECQETIKLLNDKVEVNYCGALSHDQIAEAFGNHDAFIFPTLSENYGHVISEALISGCIPIISDRTPWSDINETNSGWALPLQDEDAFVSAIQEIIDMNNDKIGQYRENIKTYLKKKTCLKDIHGTYEKMFNKRQMS